MKIIECTLENLDALVEIARKTFYETFADTNTESNMKEFLENAYSKYKLKQEILEKESKTFLAVENNGSDSKNANENANVKNEKILGFLKINIGKAQTEKMFSNALEIQRIYVLKEAKGKGIGTAFMNLAEQIAKKLNISLIWLGVWEHNESAKSFYAKKGFVRFAEHSFMVGNDKQNDWLLKKELNTNYTSKA